MKKAILVSFLLIVTTVPLSNNGMQSTSYSAFIVAAGKKLASGVGTTASYFGRIAAAPFKWLGSWYWPAEKQNPQAIQAGPAHAAPSYTGQTSFSSHIKQSLEEEARKRRVYVPTDKTTVRPAESDADQQSSEESTVQQSATRRKRVAEPIASSSNETPGNPALENNEALRTQERLLRQELGTVYLLPPLKDLMKAQVCPPFAQLKEEPIYYKLSGETLAPAYVSTPTGDVNNVRCAISSSYKGYNLEFYQLRTINQTMKVDGEQIFVDTCGALALFAAEKMSNYARTGDAGILRSLYDVAQARLKAEQCYYPKSGQLSPRSKQLQGKELELKKERLYSEQVQHLLDSSLDFAEESDRQHIAILESPQNIVGGGVEASSAWGFERDPMRKVLVNGLRHRYFYYNWIMGNEDEVERGQRGGHWYCVALLKVDKMLQFIVIDSLSHYHLQPDSYDYQRLVIFAKMIIDTWLPKL